MLKNDEPIVNKFSLIGSLFSKLVQAPPVTPHRSMRRWCFAPALIEPIMVIGLFLMLN